jgi:uncharacterized membrane protein YiaA
MHRDKLYTMNKIAATAIRFVLGFILFLVGLRTAEETGREYFPFVGCVFIQIVPFSP